MLAFSGYPPVSKIIASIALTFFAFLGFGVMTFTVAELGIPTASCRERWCLRSGLTTATYVLISIGVFGTLTVDRRSATARRRSPRRRGRPSATPVSR